MMYVMIVIYQRLTYTIIRQYRYYRNGKTERKQIKWILKQWQLCLEYYGVTLTEINIETIITSSKI